VKTAIAASEPDSKEEETKPAAASEPKLKLEDLASRRKPDPSKDDQLRKALDLLKNPSEWQQSLGQGVQKLAEEKKKADEKKAAEEKKK